ncbi:MULTISPECIES: hypothetical protein [Geobacillus]|uniref:Uncharacterized protein n=1 Tax=Geobacillus stearothermophilus TaxID=1422 RepID=A0A916P5V6_GEOSE|nr:MULTISPECIES: hypothetical protein [Geobacillus]TWG24954.1 hypothetical protein GC56T2_3544 [Geobacillus sp. C56-T2]CAP08235.1 hypothetical protein pGS18_ORF24 [Geobacillus stearothermophilus]
MKKTEIIEFLNNETSLETLDIKAMVEEKVQEDLLRFRTCATDPITSW